MEKQKNCFMKRIEGVIMPISKAIIIATKDLPGIIYALLLRSVMTTTISNGLTVHAQIVVVGSAVKK